MRGSKARTIEEVLALPEEEIDIAIAILLLSKQWDDTVDVEKYRKQIDRMAASLQPVVTKQEDPYAIVKSFNSYIFQELGYKALDLAPVVRFSAQVSEEPFLLHSLLDRKIGNCTSLSALYLSLAERLELPIYGVAVAQHIFVRYDDSVVRINIETTDNGNSFSDDYYRKRFRIPTETAYLVNLSKRQVIGYLLTNLGTLCAQQGRIEEAISNLKTGISVNPDYAEEHVNLGFIYLHQGRLEEAAIELKTAVSIDPNLLPAHVNLGSVYLEQDKLDEAAVELSAVVNISPDLAEAHVNLGIVYGEQGKLGEAIAQYKTAIGLDPDLAEAHYNLGSTYAEQNNREDAIAHLTEFIRLANANPILRDGVPEVQRMIDDLKKHREVTQ
jgi:regulator of sirC expression with transglutaminase-like and TPR domain